MRYVPAFYLCARELTATLVVFNRYAIRESSSLVKIFKNFKEKKSFKPDFGAEGNVNMMYCRLVILEVDSSHYLPHCIYSYSSL